MATPSLESTSIHGFLRCALLLGLLGRSTSFTTFALVIRHHVTASSHLLATMTGQDQDASEFELLQEALYRQELNKRRESTWLASVQSLPFECTECGNCCRTEGNVYLSPEELRAASAYKDMKPAEFVEKYAIKTIDDISSKGDEEEDDHLPWVLVKDTETDEGPTCVFLDPITHHCSIYPVRPIQCSTYPFWPKILASEGHWNDEARRKDADTTSSLPSWTPKKGGCEGMQLLDAENVKEGNGVAIDDAIHQLSLYERSDRRMPRDHRNDYR